MNKICRICFIDNKHTEFIPLLKEYPNSSELVIEGEEFEYCFDLRVLEVPNYIQICTECQQKLHNFYLFKQQAIKSHYELLNKNSSVIKADKKDDEKKFINKDKSETDVFNNFGNVNYSESVNLENIDCILKQDIKDEFEEVGDEELQEIDKMSLEIFVDEYNANTNVEKNNVEVNDGNRSEGSADVFEQIMAEEDTKRKLKNKRKNRNRDTKKNSSFRRLKCELCGKGFVMDETYNAHMRTHKGLPAYSCEICGKGFNLKEGVLYHMKNHNNQRDFVCEICSKAYLTKFDLRTHMKCHSDEKQFICDICGKLTRFHSELTAHRESHAEENKYECKICHLKLHTSRTLRGHIKACHEYNNPKLYCTVCEKQFTRKYRFVAHTNKLHPEKQLE